MKALTLWRPWDLLVVSGIKRIENRPWAPGARLQIGERFAIHAGKTWDPGAIEMAQRLGHSLDLFDGKQAPGCIVGVVTYQGCVTESDDHWFFGPYGWVLSNPERVEPLPIRGMQGLWEIPGDYVGQLRRAA